MPNLLTSAERQLAEQYWTIREPLLPPCAQCTNAVISLGDYLSETFLVHKKHLIEEVMKEPLMGTYAFTRIYYHNSKLAKHKDIFSCEVSVTINIMADKDWKIWFSKDDSISNFTAKPGEAIAYEGTEYDHWRDAYEGQKCIQVLLHYVYANGKNKNWIDTGRISRFRAAQQNNHKSQMESLIQ